MCKFILLSGHVCYNAACSYFTYYYKEMVSYIESLLHKNVKKKVVSITLVDFNHNNYLKF